MDILMAPAGISLRLGEHQAEPGAAARGRFDFHLAVVQLHDPVDHGQADAASLFLGREIEIENSAEMTGNMSGLCSRTIRSS